MVHVSVCTYVLVHTCVHSSTECTNSHLYIWVPLPVCFGSRYSLTHKGAALAHRLLLVGSSGEAGSLLPPQGAGCGTCYSSHSESSGTEASSKPQHPPTASSPSCPPTNPVSPQNSVADCYLQMHNHLMASESPPRQVASSTGDTLSPALPVKPLQHWYIDTDGRCVLEKDKAAVTFDCKLPCNCTRTHTHARAHAHTFTPSDRAATILVGYLIKCLKKDLLQSRVKYILDRSR